jgi:hypothetical protein
MVSPEYEWNLAFFNPAWRMSVGQTFPIVLTFDNRQTINVSGKVLNKTLVGVAMPVQSSLVRAFRSARLMSAFAQGSLFQFKLTGTSVLIPSLVDCVKITKAEGLAAARDFTHRPRIAAPQMGPSPDSSTSKNEGEHGNTDFKAEAAVIAANLLSHAGITGFRLATSADIPEVKADAIWIADDVIGTINIMPTLRSSDLDEVRSILIGADAKFCKGTFFSGSVEDSENNDGPQLSRVFTTCQVKEQPTTSYYLAVPRKTGGMYILRTMTRSQSEKPAKEADSSIRKAVYSAIPK